MYSCGTNDSIFGSSKSSKSRYIDTVLTSRINSFESELEQKSTLNSDPTENDLKLQEMLIKNEKLMTMTEKNKFNNKIKIKNSNKKYAFEKKLIIDQLASDLLNLKLVGKSDKEKNEKRYYLIHNLIPSVVMGLENLLKEICAVGLILVQDGFNELYDNSWPCLDDYHFYQNENVNIPRSYIKRDLNPIDYLAKYLMRHNPKYQNCNNAYAYSCNKIAESLKCKLDIDINDRLGAMKKNVQENRIIKEQILEIEKKRQKYIIDSVENMYINWNTLDYVGGKIPLKIIKQAIKNFVCEFNCSLTEKMTEIMQDVENNDKLLIKKIFVEYVCNFVLNYSPTIFEEFVNFMKKYSHMYQKYMNFKRVKQNLHLLFLDCDMATTGYLNRNRVINLLMLYCNVKTNKNKNVNLKDPTNWPIRDLENYIYDEIKSPYQDKTRSNVEVKTKVKDNEFKANNNEPNDYKHNKNQNDSLTQEKSTLSSLSDKSSQSSHISKNSDGNNSEKNYKSDEITKNAKNFKIENNSIDIDIDKNKEDKEDNADENNKIDDNTRVNDNVIKNQENVSNTEEPAKDEENNSNKRKSSKDSETSSTSVISSIKEPKEQVIDENNKQINKVESDSNSIKNSYESIKISDKNSTEIINDKTENNNVIPNLKNNNNSVSSSIKTTKSIMEPLTSDTNLKNKRNKNKKDKVKYNVSFDIDTEKVAENYNYNRDEMNKMRSRFDVDQINEDQFVHICSEYINKSEEKQFLDTFCRYFREGYAETVEEREEKLKNIYIQQVLESQKIISNDLFQYIDNDGSGNIESNLIFKLMYNYKDGSEIEAIHKAQEHFDEVENVSSVITKVNIDKCQFLRLLQELANILSNFSNEFESICEFIKSSIKIDYQDEIRGEMRKKWINNLDTISKEWRVDALNDMFNSVFQIILNDGEIHGNEKTLSAFVSMLEFNNMDEVSEKGNYSLVYVAATMLDAPLVLGKRIHEKQTSLSFDCLKTNSPIHVPNVKSHGKVKIWEKSTRDGSFIVMPLKDSHDRSYGIFGIDTLRSGTKKKPQYFSIHEILFYEGLTKKFCQIYDYINNRNAIIKLCGISLDWLYMQNLGLDQVSLYFVETVNDNKVKNDYKLIRVFNYKKEITERYFNYSYSLHDEALNKQVLESENYIFYNNLFDCVNNAQSVEYVQCGKMKWTIPIRDQNFYPMFVMDITINPISEYEPNDSVNENIRADVLNPAIQKFDIINTISLVQFIAYDILEKNIHKNNLTNSDVGQNIDMSFYEIMYLEIQKTVQPIFENFLMRISGEVQGVIQENKMKIQQELENSIIKVNKELEQKLKIDLGDASSRKSIYSENESYVTSKASDATKSVSMSKRSSKVDIAPVKIELEKQIMNENKPTILNYGEILDQLDYDIVKRIDTVFYTLKDDEYVDRFKKDCISTRMSKQSPINRIEGDLFNKNLNLIEIDKNLQETIQKLQSKLTIEQKTIYNWIILYLALMSCSIDINNKNFVRYDKKKNK